jgi:hypothetical protein
LQRAATIYDAHQQNRSNPRMDNVSQRRVYAAVHGGYPSYDDGDEKKLKSILSDRK